MFAGFQAHEFQESWLLSLSSVLIRFIARISFCQQTMPEQAGHLMTSNTDDAFVLAAVGFPSSVDQLVTMIQTLELLGTEQTLHLERPMCANEW